MGSTNRHSFIMPSPLSQSPLFAQAAKAVQEAVHAGFTTTSFGSTLRRVKAAALAGRAGVITPGGLVDKALQRYQREGKAGALKELMGHDFSQFCAEIEKYSRATGSSKELVARFLDSLGPAGKVLKSFALGRGSQRDLDWALRLVRAFGYEVLPPPGKRTRASLRRAVPAMVSMLRDLGVNIEVPEELDKTQPKTRGRVPQATPYTTTDRFAPLGRRTLENGRVEVQMGFGLGSRQFAKDHPVVTGRMVRSTSSSNVWSYGYDVDSLYLYVRYHGREHGTAGPLYRYSGVYPHEFLTLLDQDSKGKWVWDHLRLRGSRTIHQKPYELVGITGDYVPRRAARVGGEDWWVNRQVLTTGGRIMESTLQARRAGWSPERPERGTPMRSD
jgi:hypothetical protein